ncbi:MAG TPA: TIGR03000 domain-containing protein [Gemmataceae bacterium]|nr:TIGR03000 domain-containing protein [Gemmataceae bacterium]
MRMLFAAALAAAVAASAAAQEKKTATIKLMIPEKPTKTAVTIEGKKLDEPAGVKDAVRVFTTPDLESGKTYAYKIEVVIEPNNYTKIFRTREVTFKAGETVSVDVRSEDKAVPDRIEVRWVPTPDDIVDEMCKMAKVGKDDVIHDYGCGDAVMLIRPIKNLGAKKGFGNDIDPKMVEKAKENVKTAGLEDKITIVEGDILKMTEKDCAEATVVLLYIGDDLGAKLSPLLQKSLKPGTRIVSHRFKLGDWKPDKSVTVTGADGDMYDLHLWTVPEKKK